MLGFAAISIASIIPEFIAALTGTMLKQGEIVFGTVIGSNIFKIPLIGIILLIGKNVKNDTNAIGNAPILTLFLTILPFILAYDNSLGRIDGAILIIAYLVYISSLLRNYPLGNLKKKVSIKDIYKDLLIFLGSLLAILISARFLIERTIIISGIAGVPVHFIAIIVIGAAASMPELAYQLRIVIRNKEKIGTGYLLGTIVANSTLVFGIVSFIKPVVINFSVLLNMGFFLLGGTILTISFLNRQELNRKHGILFMLVYIAFLISEVIFYA